MASGETPGALCAYGARAEEYVEAVGRIEHTAEADRTRVGAWAASVDGPVLDVGAGPGQWTNWLREQGAEVSGVDPVPEFVERAQRDYPATRYTLGEASSLDAAHGAVAGLMAWYSLIHLAPDEVGRALAEFARVVRPGGSLLLGFFTADRHDQFDHAVAPAWYWPIDLIAAWVERAGFAVVETETRAGRPGRTHGALIAVRTSRTGG